MQPSIIVHQFPPVIDMQPSPFGLKLETWLRMVGLAYTVSWSPQEMGPKGKVPFATIDGIKIGDSELVIEHLAGQIGYSLEDNLEDKEKARSILIRRLVEEHLYHILVYSRWADPEGWASFKPLFFAPAPAVIRGFIARKVQKAVTGNLYAQGISRHTTREVYHKAEADLLALATLLGSRTWFIGETPTVTDASAYGLIANMYYSPLHGKLQEILNRHANLVDFCQRMKKSYWPDAKLGGGDEACFGAQAISRAVA